MARTKHRKIKNLVYGNTKEVKDEEFFTSKEFQAYLQDILDVISCSYDTKKIVRISVNWDTDEKAKIACTDSERLYINAGTYLMKNVSARAERFEGVLGLMLHETGHLLYTNFQKSMDVMNGMMKNYISMIPDKKHVEAYEAYEKVRDYMATIKNPDVLQMICHLWKHLVNCLEDGHIDWRISSRYPGYKPYLDFVNDLCFDYLPSVSEIRQARNKKKQECPDEPVFLISDFIQYLLMYSRYGFLKGEEWEIVKEEAALKVYDLIDWIDFAKDAKNSEQRILFQSIVFYLAFPFDYIDSLLAKYGNEDNSTVSQESQDSLNDVLQSMQSAEGLSSTTSNSLSSSISKSGNTPAGDSKKSDNDSENHEGQMPSKESNSQSQDQSNANEQEKIGSSSEETDGSNEESVGEQASEQEMEVKENDEKFDLNKAKAMSHTNSEDRKKGLATAEKDMQRVLDKMSKNENLRTREKHFESELQSFAASVNHRDIHKGVKSKVNRIDVPEQSLIDGYHKIWPQISPISKKLQGRLLKQLEKKRKGSNQHNLYFGRKLEPSALVRGDGKCFSKRSLPGSKKELAVGLLVDESGSMSLADRITHARITALLLYDFCEKLGIPIAVYGHSAGYGPVLLNAYAEYDSVDKNDRYRIMSMDCHGCNRDGYALRYVADRLLTQNAEVKLLFIISDGKPADDNYSGESAYEDLALIKKEYFRKGIITIAAAIGNDKKTIEHIYGKEAFLDVTDLNALPSNLISIIKNYL